MAIRDNTRRHCHRIPTEEKSAPILIALENLCADMLSVIGNSRVGRKEAIRVEQFAERPSQHQQFRD